jgi:hypothetical protein
MTVVAQIASGGPRLNRGAFLVALVAGAAGVLVPIVPAVSGLLLWFFPPIGVAVLAAWAWLTVRWRRRGGFPMRRWAAVTWFLLVGPLTLLVTIAFLPPGSGLPEGDDARRVYGAMLAFTVAGSALLAALALWAGNRLAAHQSLESPSLTSSDVGRQD